MSCHAEETSAAPLQVRGEVLANEPAGAYRVLTTTAPGVPGRASPGQFVAVAVGGDRSPMLGRRAFSIYEAVAGGETRPAGPVATRGDQDTVSIVFAVHGGGTAWLAGLGPGDALDLVGPLGHPFTPPAREASAPDAATRCVLVGGGYGSAPLFSLAELLRGRGYQVDLVLGAAGADRVFGAQRARRSATSTAITTVDGSLGRRGIVTDALLDLLGRGDTVAVYACGPMPMLRAVAAAASEHGVPAQVAVEESMACGIGVCMTCVLPVLGTDGATRMTRSCVEGPVFPGDSVRWDVIGTVPADAVGANT